MLLALEAGCTVSSTILTRLPCIPLALQTELFAIHALLDGLPMQMRRLGGRRKTTQTLSYHVAARQLLLSDTTRSGALQPSQCGQH
jgi:hypothetical protein